MDFPNNLNEIAQNRDRGGHRKRLLAAEEYRETKRFLTENFVKMCITTKVAGSQPSGETTAESMRTLDTTSEDSMDEISDSTRIGHTGDGESSDTHVSGPGSLQNDDSTSPTSTDTYQPEAHPFRRPSLCKVDQVLEGWIRRSRLKLQIDTHSETEMKTEMKTEASQSPSQALILYNSPPPVGLTEQGSNKPTEKTYAMHTGDSNLNEEGRLYSQHCSIGTENINVNEGGEINSSSSWEDTDAFQLEGKSPAEFPVVDDAEMEVDSDGLAGGEDEPPTNLPELTRVGTSRGPPTPFLTPEVVADARMRGKDSLAHELVKVGLLLSWATGSDAFGIPLPKFTHAGVSGRGASSTSKSVLPDGLIFDCDGVLADTERDGHRAAFNTAFKTNGLDLEWGVEQYGKLLEVGGGKERMTAYWNVCWQVRTMDIRRLYAAIGIHDTISVIIVGWPESAQTPEAKTLLVRELHLLKTAIFNQLILDGKIPLRPGVLRLVDEAIYKNVPLAVCSTSNDKAVTNLVATLMGDKRLERITIFAGDIVEKKKPSPDIYNLAKDTLGLDPARVVVIEDSYIGLTSAKAAGMNCLVTRSSYTKDEDFSAADKVVDELGKDPTLLDSVTLATLGEIVDARVKN